MSNSIVGPWIGLAPAATPPAFQLAAGTYTLTVTQGANQKAQNYSTLQATGGAVDGLDIPPSIGAAPTSGGSGPSPRSLARQPNGSEGVELQQMMGRNGLWVIVLTCMAANFGVGQSTGAIGPGTFRIRPLGNATSQPVNVMLQ